MVKDRAFSIYLTNGLAENLLLISKTTLAEPR